MGRTQNLIPYLLLYLRFLSSSTRNTQLFRTSNLPLTHTVLEMPELIIGYQKTSTMVLPLFKLGTLALRTISKPIANRLKKEAGLHPTFRQFIINIAQANHRFTTTVQRRLYGHATNALIRPLDEGRAVQLASELFGELFVFTVAGMLLIYEVHRSSRAESRKEEKRKQEMEALKQKNKDLERELELLKYRQSAQGRGYLDFVKLWHAGTLEGHKWGRPSYMNAM